MSVWAIGLILSVAGIFVIVLRRLPAAVKDAQASLPSVPTVPVEVKTRAPKPTPPPVVPKSRPKVFPSFGKKKAVQSDVQSAKPEVLADLATEVLMTRGEEQFQAKSYNDARLTYEELLRRKEDPKWYNRLGVIDLELERFHEARDAFRAALRFGDDVASRHANLGLAEFALGHRLTAIRYLRTAVALAPNHRRYQELLESIESSK